MIAAATLHALSIPFRERFRHAAADRAACDSVVVRVVDRDGCQGWGEGAPRPHVTGETVDTVLADLAAAWPAVTSTPPPYLERPADLARLALPAGLRGAARAALELAVLDILLRRAGRSLASLLPARRSEVRYSGVVGAVAAGRARGIAEVFRAYRIADVKVKVGFPGDLESVRAVRAALGPRATIRVDANGAWRPSEALSAIARLADHGVECVEQPLPRGAVAELAALRARSPLPLMADESLVTAADARELAAAGAVDHFNIRVSKCGGLGPCLAIAAVARDAGIGVQVGCQAGETAILSAAGRHFAAGVERLLHAEGSFGEALLVEDLGHAPVMFGAGGEAPLLTGPGLGIEVDAERVRRWTRRTVELGALR
ncbi:MAG TPA: enolase C-terminal domain-like protein [Terriglobales bacterium]|nr:enolase C-terminal domain-like protein [Terriglobales bacterium]